jgi:hypothetical protein
VATLLASMNITGGFLLPHQVFVAREQLQGARLGNFEILEFPLAAGVQDVRFVTDTILPLKKSNASQSKAILGIA